MEEFNELENMAVAATYEEESDDNNESLDSNKTTIKMWQDKFGYTYEQAVELLQITKSSKPTTNLTRQPTLTPGQARTIYAFKLEGPLSTPQRVQSVAALTNVPESYNGSGEEGGAVFCKIDGVAKMAIENWISQNDCSFRPLFVPEGKAYKELSEKSMYPTLGKDATFPQNRPQDEHLIIRTPTFGREQDEFPVWYFFYGTLASVPKLRNLFSMSEHDRDPVFHEALIRRGKMETWGQGKYNALVDGWSECTLQGVAYQVMCEEHEDILRKYETSAYEVVRCSIEISGWDTIEGCTFRFIGKID